jgi:biopolymer transport protein ExbD
MKINLDTPIEEVRIEIIPLIDVIFCILTFFILAALQMTRQQAINVELPKASSGVPQMREMLIVTLDDFGQVYVEQQQMSSIDQLSGSLKNYNSTNPNGLMVLYASRTASYNDVVQVLDLLRTVGGDRVALATLPGTSQPTPNSTQVPQNPNVPGLTPYSGTNPVDPSNPNPGQPNLPVNPGQIPSGQGVNPTSPGNVPLTPTIPAPGTNAPITPNIPTPGATNAPAQGDTAPRR